MNEKERPEKTQRTNLFDVLFYGMAFVSVIGFFGDAVWWFDVFAHFRVQYAWGFVVFAGAFLIAGKSKRHCRRHVAVSLALAALNGAVVSPCYFGKTEASEAAVSAIKIMLVNVNTTRGNPEKVRDAVLAEAPDVLVLQEVSQRWLHTLNPTFSPLYPHTEQVPRDNNFGIALWSKMPLRTVEVVYSVERVPTIVAEFAPVENSASFVLFATHPVPPIGATYTHMRNRQLVDIATRVVQMKSPVVVVGDLNTTPWGSAYRKFTRTTNLRSAANGRGVFPTWSPDNPLLSIPLDHVLLSRGIGVRAFRTGPDVGSDHVPVIAELTLPRVPPAVAQSDAQPEYVQPWSAW